MGRCRFEKDGIYITLRTIGHTRYGGGPSFTLVGKRGSYEELLKFLEGEVNKYDFEQYYRWEADGYYNFRREEGQVFFLIGKLRRDMPEDMVEEVRLSIRNGLEWIDQSTNPFTRGSGESSWGLYQEVPSLGTDDFPPLGSK